MANATAPENKPPAFDASDVVEKVLPNGLTVLVCERHNTSTVAIELSVLAGSRFDQEETAGLAALTGRLLTEGTSTRSSEEIALMIESAGGSLISGAGTEGSMVSASTLAKDFDLGLDLCADVLTQPAFDEARVALERERTISEIRSSRDRPRTVLDWRFNELIYKGHPLHFPSVGYEDRVAGISREQIRNFHERFYFPGNCYLAVVGDFESAEVLKKIEDRLGGWNQPMLKLPTLPPIERQTMPCEDFVEMPKEQVNIYVGHLGIVRLNPDYYALNVMDVILGSAPGFTSRVPKRLRDEQGLAYSTFANITSSAGLDPGRFVAYIGTSPENRQRAIDGILGEIRLLVEKGVTEAELRDARQYLTGSFVFHFQTNAQVTHFMVLAKRYGIGFDYAEKFPVLINAVSLEDVARVAKQYLHPEASTVVVVGPRE